MAVGGPKWNDGTMVQAWVSFEDPDSRGQNPTYITYTCTAQYSQRSLFASNVSVENFKGTRPFTVEYQGTNIRYDQINRGDIDNDGEWQADLTELAAYYGSTFKKGISSQSCGAVLPLSTVKPKKEGENDGNEAERTIENNTLKYGVEYKVTSGWRAWENDEATKTNGGGDGDAFLLYLWQPGSNDSAG